MLKFYQNMQPPLFKNYIVVEIKHYKIRILQSISVLSQLYIWLNVKNRGKLEFEISYTSILCICIKVKVALYWHIGTCVYNILYLNACRSTIPEYL